MKSLVFASFIFTQLALYPLTDLPANNYTEIPDKSKLLILNPALASRKTSKIRLPNGLQVYLISDPDTKQSGAGLSVEVGSWQDPKEYPGMAHFCEHMLFMGTTAYPKEEEYMQYIHDHGGNVNAYTAPDRTVYMFSINHEGFTGALNRFSHFFIDPLFSTSCINRELHAVDQEHAKNIENDGYRQYMVFKETGNPAHPNALFCTGNAKTLSGIPQSALKKWYESHYSARLMHLVVLSPLPMETLKSLVSKDFSAVPDHPVAKQPIQGPLFSAKQKGHMIYIKPIKEMRSLTLTWEMPKECARDGERKGAELIAYALQSEGINSLNDQLKKERIAESLKVSSDRFDKDGLLLSIDINLTPYGMTQIDTAILRCFQAIAKLKETGIPPYLFDEMQKMSKLNYQYQSREDAFSFTSQQAHDLIDEPFETYPEKTLVPSVYDPHYLSALLQLLTPNSCLFFLQADPHLSGVLPDTKEKWMQVDYAVREIPPEKLQTWTQARPLPDLVVCSPNPFIPQHLGLIHAQKEEKKEVFPILLSPTPEEAQDKDASGMLYFAEDTHYLVPETAAFFHLKSPLLDGTAKSMALGDLFLNSLGEKLAAPLFFAETAGLRTHFRNQDLQISLIVEGYSEKAPVLIKTLFDGLKTNLPTKQQFDIYKQTLLTVYDNSDKELPVVQAKYLLESVLRNDAPLASDKSCALKGVSYEDFVLFSQSLFKTAYLQAFLYGNLTELEARAIWADARQSLGAASYPLREQIKKQILLLPEKLGPFLLVQNTERQGHGIILALEEGPFSFEKRAAQRLLSKALQGDFFETLRTKQQTAYIAQAWDRELERQLLQIFAVQSNTHHPRDLLARFELFLEEFSKNVEEKIPQERFEMLQNMLVTTLRMVPENLQAMGDRLDTFAFEYGGDFKWLDKQIAALQHLNYSKLSSYAEEFLSRKNTRRLAVLMEGVLHHENDFQYKIVSKETIGDLGSYVALDNTH